MTIKQITPGYFVAPQIDAEDLPAIAKAGITRIICNRPDGEVPPSHQAEAIGAAAKAAGLGFDVIPVTMETLDLAMVADQAAICDKADGPVLAYCRSGTRSTIVWALGQAGTMPVDEIIAAAASAGYDIGHLAPTLTDLASQKG